MWGRAALFASCPRALAGFVQDPAAAALPGLPRRIILVGLAVALLLYVVVTRTRLGMLIRAGASNRTMVAALGVNIRLLFTSLRLRRRPRRPGRRDGRADLQVQPGMGEEMLIQVLVVIVIGGIGSIRGAWWRDHRRHGRHDGPRVPEGDAAHLLRPPRRHAGPALASMLIYILMAAVLYFRPQGLFPARSGLSHGTRGPAASPSASASSRWRWCPCARRLR